MPINRAIDEIETLNLYLTSTLTPVLPTLPEFYTVEMGILDALRTQILGVMKTRTCVGVQKATNLGQRKMWTEKADVSISRSKLYLRATAPDVLKEYYPESHAIASRKIDRLHVITKALTVSEHFGHTHLGAFRAEFEALKAEGVPIFDAASVAVVDQKTEVEKLQELKVKWEAQYQKLKFLIRGYFYNSSTDWAKFFDEKRLAKVTTAKDDASHVAATASPVELAS
jgi:hypothetical protein